MQGVPATNNKNTTNALNNFNTMTMEELQHRIPLVQSFNACIAEILPSVDFSMVSKYKAKRERASRIWKSTVD